MRDHPFVVVVVVVNCVHEHTICYNILLRVTFVFLDFFSSHPPPPSYSSFIFNVPINMGGKQTLRVTYSVCIGGFVFNSPLAPYNITMGTLACIKSLLASVSGF